VQPKINQVLVTRSAQFLIKAASKRTFSASKYPYRKIIFFMDLDSLRGCLLKL